jgi:hypothetical protein
MENEIMEDKDDLTENETIAREGVSDDGEEPGHTEEQTVMESGEGGTDKDDPYRIKKRLGQQAKKHEREMRHMKEQMAMMQSHLERDNANHQYSNDVNPYPSQGQPMPPGMTEEEKIQRAVHYALSHKDNEERQIKEAERHAHVQKQYHRLNDEFDRASDKYDDFDDVVRGDDMPFTPHVRDALLLVDNPADVAYRLGKNRAELERISKLHPLDQAREVNKLSFSLMGGNNGKSSQTTRSNPLGAVKANPANSSGAINDKTPASVIRARMKAGTFK